MVRSVVALVSGLGIAAAAAATIDTGSPDELTAHEWGTFTTVAGPDGRAIDWLPLGGPSDLPCFVEHYQNRRDIKVLFADPGRPVDYTEARSVLQARVRMETPVIYFYSPRATTVSVSVQFPHGLLTEWYPHADVSQPLVGAGAFRSPNLVSTLSWPSVRIAPSDPAAFLTEPGRSHYYAARATDASPLRVSTQSERFLFYRGVADFDPPIASTLDAGGSIRIKNLSSSEIPAVIVFERRGANLGFRVVGAVSGETTVPAPTLDGNFDALRVALEGALTTAGLHAKEAAAMIETWRDSWFEEGTRVIYLVPRKTVDALLPLAITPAPAHTARVFVGRMEVITPATEHAVETAIANKDQATLELFGRFLAPISDRIRLRTADPLAKADIIDVASKAFASYLRRVNGAAVCE